MRAGIAAMELLDEAAFARLDAMGEAVRSGIDAAFRRHNVPGRTVGLGSLLKIHFADRPVRDYRSAYPTEEEAKRQAVFNRALLNRGVLAAGNGLMALSTPMTDADIDAIIDAASGALAEVSASPDANSRTTRQAMSAKIDPITRSVVQHRLSSIVKEMGEAMLRTSYSQILNSSRDFSLAICDTRGRLIAQADHLPVHVGALPWATLAVEERFKDVVPGDVFLLNDPYHGGSHLPDLTAFVPVFDGDKRLLWTIVRAHQSDIGGATHGAYNPGATEIWQEGLRIPPIKLSEAGRPREDLLDMLALNVRNPREFRGDLAAMLGAAHLGERRVSKLFSEFGAPVVEAAIEAILDATEQQTRAVVSTWKDGVFHGEAFLDDDGHGRSDIRIAAKVTKKGSDVEVDLSESDPQSTSFVNSSHANMQAAVAMAFAYLIDAEIPKNTGALRPLKVIAKQGTIVWADPGRPVTLCTSHPSNEIVEAIVKAMSASCPERAMAGWSRRFRIAIQGEDPRTGKNFIWHMFQARPGGGASSGGDGWSSIGEWHSGRRPQIRQPRSRRGALSLAFPPAMNSAQAPAATASSAAASASPSIWCWRSKSPRAAIPRATARATAPAACSAARTASRITIACCPKAASRACCAPRKSASNSSRRLPRDTLLRRRRLGAAGEAIGGSAPARRRARPDRLGGAT